MHHSDPSSEELRAQLGRLLEQYANLNPNQAQFRDMADLAPVLVCVTRQGRIQYLNPFGAALLGARDSEEFGGRRLARLAAGADAEALAWALREAEEKGRTTPLADVEFASSKGRSVATELAAAPMTRGSQPAALVVAVDATQRRRQERALDAIITATVGKTGQEFFDATVERLASWLGAEVCLLGEFVEGGRIRAVAMRMDGQKVEGYSYELEGTPCRHVSRDGFLHCREGVCQLYPNDADLQEMGATGYVGVTLLDNQRRFMGVLCALSRQPFLLPERARDVMETLGARAAAELERARALQSLRESNARLEERVAQSTAELRQAVEDLRKEVEERKRATELLTSSESTARALLDATPETACLLDLDGTVLAINETGASRLRHKPEELVGRDIGACFPTELSSKRREKLREVVEQGRPSHWRDERDGMHFDIRVHPVLGPEGEVARVAAFARDITDQLRQEQDLERLAAELDRQRRTLHQVLANSPDMFFMFDHQGLLLYANPSAAQNLSLNQTDVVGVHWRKLGLPEGVMKPMVKQGVTVFETGEHAFGEASTVLEGQEHHLEWVLSPLRNSEGVIESVVATMRDVTKRVQAEEELRRSEERYRTLMQNFPEGAVMMFDHDLRCTLIDGAGLGEVGLDKTGMEDKLITDLLKHGAVAELEPHLRAALRGQAGTSVLAVGDRLYEVRTAPLFDEDGQVMAGMAVTLDVTKRLQFERQQQMTARVFENSIEGIVVADADGKVVMVNPAFHTITGYEPDEVIGREIDILRGGSHSDEFLKDVWQSLTETGQWSGEYWNHRRNGEAYPEWLTLSIIKDSQSRVLNYVAIFHDITEIKRSQEQIHYQAHHDALTGLPNRLLFDDRLEQALNHARRNQELVGVMFLDLDNFKRINDSLGHEQGDILLKAVAKRLSRCLRAADTVARLGGDEFIIITPEVEEQAEVVNVAERILEVMSEPFAVGDSELHIGASIGLTMHPADGQDPVTLVKNADMAMYRAKELGGSRYQLYTPSMNEQAVRRLTLETQLRAALENGDFEVHYQPKVSLADRRVVGAEALVRWRRADGSLEPPGGFIGVAEDSGLIIPLGRLVMEEACRRAKQWQARSGNGFSMSVNLSARQFQQEPLEEMVAALLRRTGLPPKRLELEITESTMMLDVEKAVHVSNRLAEMGVLLSVDDFGTGYSSFNYIKRFPIRFIKVDRSFIRDLTEDQGDAAIVQAIISMAHTLGIKVVAEGVETREQSQFLHRAGCDQVQGYFFGRPMPAEDFGQVLRESPVLQPRRDED